MSIWQPERVTGFWDGKVDRKPEDWFRRGPKIPALILIGQHCSSQPATIEFVPVRPIGTL